MSKETTRAKIERRGARLNITISTFNQFMIDHVNTTPPPFRGRYRYPWAKCDGPGRWFFVPGKTARYLSVLAVRRNKRLKREKKGYRFCVRSCSMVLQADQTWRRAEYDEYGALIDRNAVEGALVFTRPTTTLKYTSPSAPGDLTDKKYVEEE